MGKKKKQPRKKATESKPSNTQPKTDTQIASSEQKYTLERKPGMKYVLHVGCGDSIRGSRLHKIFKTPEWEEVRLDIDPTMGCDIVADMCDMHMIEDQQFDAIWSSHNVEHIFAHQIPIAFGEFFRVLRQDGFAFISCPDIQAVGEHIAKGRLEDDLYESPAGPIAAIDVIFGHRLSIRDGSSFMAHKTAYTAQTLGTKLARSGFADIVIQRDEDHYNLWAKAYRRAEQTESNAKVKIIQKDVNDMMRVRDELDKEPVLWEGLGDLMQG